MRTDFTEVQLPAEFAQLFPADQDALFASIRPQISDDVLLVISEEDCGYDIESHFNELVRIRDGIDLDRPIGWEPNEVLCLFRWSERSHHPSGPFAESYVFHRARAFCCCALLRCPDHAENRSLFEQFSLAPLIESCQQLGELYLERLLAYLSWSLQTMEPWDEDYLFHAHGWLIAYASLANSEQSLIERFGVWLIEAERKILPWHKLSPKTSPEEAARMSLWIRIGEKLLGLAKSPAAEEQPTASRQGRRTPSFLDISDMGRTRWRFMLQQVIPMTEPDGALRAYLESF